MYAIRSYYGTRIKKSFPFFGRNSFCIGDRVPLVQFPVGIPVVFLSKFFSFFGVFFVDGTMFLVQLLMFNYIYAHVETIGGWSREQMLFFIGTFSLINALNMMLCFFGVISIPEKIRSGKLDLYITKPVNTLFYLSFENIDIGSLLV